MSFNFSGVSYLQYLFIYMWLGLFHNSCATLYIVTKFDQCIKFDVSSNIFINDTWPNPKYLNPEAPLKKLEERSAIKEDRGKERQ